ncbi:polyisoprenoid diphosphate/phosphate phosphohydrolase PLPP6-like [Lagopus muta]|uniref:polyisoprenoid diphosphate/phosphate phosphohydrolase PLPP6-like n=2 Tax=Tetraoninae TaxID=466585 RepID=UPI0020A13866|nr:polyisoprenoid diphosphate/phosphate phosphohydrolase PLPP6-like [Lagopus muta]
MAAAPPPPPRSPSSATRGPGGGPASPRRPPHHRRPRTGARTGAGRANAPPLLLRPSPATVRRLGAGRGGTGGILRPAGGAAAPLFVLASVFPSNREAAEAEVRQPGGGRNGAPPRGLAARVPGRLGRRRRGYSGGRRRRASWRWVTRVGLSGPGPTAMPSPRGGRERRSARPEFASLLNQRGPGVPDSPSRRRESAGSAPPPLPEEDCMRLNPSFVGIALSSLLAVDLWASKRLALVLDLVLVAVVKGIVRRPRPTHNKMDMFVTVSVDKYSFPSGHATRAALVCRFVLHHLVLAIPLRVLVVLWVLVVGISRVMLGRHNVTDVLFGLFLGYVLYSVVEYCWLSPLNAPALFALWSH